MSEQQDKEVLYKLSKTPIGGFLIWCAVGITAVLGYVGLTDSETAQLAKEARQQFYAESLESTNEISGQLQEITSTNALISDESRMALSHMRTMFTENSVYWLAFMSATADTVSAATLSRIEAKAKEDVYFIRQEMRNAPQLSPEVKERLAVSELMMSLVRNTQQDQWLLATDIDKYAELRLDAFAKHIDRLKVFFAEKGDSEFFLDEWYWGTLSEEIIEKIEKDGLRELQEEADKLRQLKAAAELRLNEQRQ